jgi:NAD(P)-dependent dehydrogenase (short-subunit alcohol dehydrogenase family)
VSESVAEVRPLLSGRSILVIGGSTGIGHACALACLAQGARVTVTSHDESSLASIATESGGAITTVVADARDGDATQAAVEKAASATGRMDGLVHVAGGSGRAWGDGPLDTITREGWDMTIELNLTSVFLSNQSAVRQFRRQGGGAIVNIGSVLATHPAPSHFTTHAYAAAKSAIEGFTRSVAARYASEGIRANVIAAGLTDTPMARRAMGDEAIRHFVSTKQPLAGGRAALPRDFGPAVAFLLSEAAGFITGQVLSIDGGWALSDGQTSPT